MSQNTEARRKAAEGWSKLLLNNSVYDKESVTDVLKNLAEEFDKRVAPIWNSNNHSAAWRNYFVAALQKVLRELPPVDYSVGELYKEIARLEGTKAPVEATASLNVSAADATAPSNANATYDNTPTTSKPVDTSSTDTTFKVDTQGHYKARIAKDGATTALEFLLNGPATVKVLVHTSTLNELIAEGSSSKSASVPSGGIAAPVAGSAATATRSATKEKKEEEKVKEKGESDEDMGFGLFD